MAALTNWLGQMGLVHRDRAERRSLPGLSAFHFNGVKAEPDTIRNISASGVYLLTNAKWPEKALVSLTLESKPQAQGRKTQTVALEAKVVRRDKEGVALEFVLPDGLDLNLWASPLQTTRDAAGPEDVLREFRLARATAFLAQICPEQGESFRTLLRKELSNYRVAGAVEIALRAEMQLLRRGETMRTHGNHEIVQRILTDGSWADDDYRQKMWASLLAFACGDDHVARQRDLVHAMSQLAAAHVMLLAVACSRSAKIVSGDGIVSAMPLVCTADQLSSTLGCADLCHIDRDLDHMAEVGLFVPREKSRFFVALDDATMTPSLLGLELYARASGHRGPLGDFYGVVCNDYSFAGAMN